MRPAVHPPHGTRPRGARPRGFSLIEVNMAILVVAGGLLALFALFPAGLRMSSSAQADTRHALFARDALSVLKANAAHLSLADWNVDVNDVRSIERFWNGISSNSPLTRASAPRRTEGGALRQTWVIEGTNTSYFAESDGTFEAVPAIYRIRLSRERPTPGSARNRLINPLRQHLGFLTWRISLIVSDQPDLYFYDNPVYHLELRYPGNP